MSAKKTKKLSEVIKENLDDLKSTNQETDVQENIECAESEKVPAELGIPYYANIDGENGIFMPVNILPWIDFRIGGIWYDIKTGAIKTTTKTITCKNFEKTFTVPDTNVRAFPFELIGIVPDDCDLYTNFFSAFNQAMICGHMGVICRTNNVIGIDFIDVPKILFDSSNTELMLNETPPLYSGEIVCEIETLFGDVYISKVVYILSSAYDNPDSIRVVEVMFDQSKKCYCLGDTSQSVNSNGHFTYVKLSDDVKNNLLNFLHKTTVPEIVDTLPNDILPNVNVPIEYIEYDFMRCIYSDKTQDNMDTNISVDDESHNVPAFVEAVSIYDAHIERTQSYSKYGEPLEDNYQVVLTEHDLPIGYIKLPAGVNSMEFAEKLAKRIQFLY